MAEGNVSADALLADAITKMDALAKRMDALETGEKNIIKGDKKRSDDDDDDKKKDDSKAEKSDDDDDKKKDDSKKRGDDDDDKKKDDAFLPAKKGKRDDDGELEIKHKKEDSKGKKADDDDDDDRKDSTKKADFTAKNKILDDSKKRGDDDDDDRKDDSSRADAVADLQKVVQAQAAEIARMSALMKPRSDDEHAAFAESQAKADAVFAGFGEHAPRPMEGESLSDYRTRMAVKLKKHSGAWKTVKLWDLPTAAFDIAEKQIYADAISAAANPVDLQPGELREVVSEDRRTGVKTSVFYGQESFVKGMGRPGRKVVSFRTMSSV